MKVFKIVNNSVAEGLVDRDGIIKSNKELGAVSLAPNLRSLWMWVIELSTNSLCPVSLPDKEDTIFIAEIELPDDMIVDFCEDAYDLENASWEKVSVIEAATADIDGWQYPKGFLGLGPTDDAPVNYGAYPEIRVKKCRVNKLYKIDKKYLKEVSYKLPYYLSDQGEPDDMGEKIKEFKKELDDLKNHMVECKLEEAFNHIRNIDILDKNDIYTTDEEKEISVYWTETPMLTGILGKALLWSLGTSMTKEPSNPDLKFFPVKSDSGCYYTKDSNRYNKVYIIRDTGYVSPRMEIDKENNSIEIRGPYNELDFSYNIYKLSRLIDVMELLNTTKSYISALRVLVALMGNIEITVPAKQIAEDVIKLIDIDYSKYVDMNVLYYRDKIINLLDRTFAYKEDIEKAWEKAVIKRYEEYTDVIKNHPYFFDGSVLYKIKADLEPGDYTDKVKIETWYDEYNGSMEIDYFIDGKSISVCMV